MATVFCFSSTGNSLYTAKKISEAISAELVSMTSDIRKCDDDVIGFIFPCYYWGLPLKVEDFISKLEMTNNNAYIFAIITYGSVAPGAMGMVNNIIREKGLKLSYGKGIKSVENYNVILKVNDSPKFHQKIDQDIKKTADEIRKNKTNSIRNYTFINRLMRNTFPALKSNCDSKFTISDSCTGCGICEKVCPANNIVIKDGKPTFIGKCEHCLGCIHACPKQAVNWNGKTEGKQRYLNPNIKLQELMNFNSQQ